MPICAQAILALALEFCAIDGAAVCNDAGDDASPDDIRGFCPRVCAPFTMAGSSSSAERFRSTKARGACASKSGHQIQVRSRSADPHRHLLRSQGHGIKIDCLKCAGIVTSTVRRGKQPRTPIPWGANILYAEVVSDLISIRVIID